jgi:hypothetical protein
MVKYSVNREIRAWLKSVMGAFDWLLGVVVDIVEDDNPGLFWEQPTREDLEAVTLKPGPVEIEPGNLENL